MRNQLGDNSMKHHERDRLRALQDTFISHPQVQQWTKVFGEHRPLWGGISGPSLQNLKEFLYPDYADKMKVFLKENG